MLFACILGVILAFAIFVIILSIKNASLFNRVRKVVYSLFLTAENIYRESGKGKEKMDWVLEQSYILLPKFAQFIWSKEAWREQLQEWFNDVKDLLDNGKLDKSIDEGDDLK